MSKNTVDMALYILLGLLLLAGMVLVYKFYTLKQDRQAEIAATQLPRYQPQQPTTFKAPRKKRIKQPKSFKDNIKPLVVEKVQGPKAPTLEEKQQILSKVTQRRFSKVAHLKIKLPESLKYVQTDIEDDMASIYGYNHVTKEELTALARPSLTSTEEIQQYLKYDKDAIPNLNGHEVTNLSKPQNVPGSARRGFSGVQVMNATMDNGHIAHVAVANRSDKKGSYIFVFTAPAGTIENNDGYVEKIYRSIKAMPEKN